MSPSRGSNFKSGDVKVIRLAGSNMVRKNSLGEPLGHALCLKAEIEQPLLDIAETANQLSHHSLPTPLTPPFPLHTVKDLSIQ